MAAYDRLPMDLRRWLSDAILPWSAASTLQLWDKALRLSDGDVDVAAERMSRLERRQIARDAIRIWGGDHPATEAD
ncbi:DUF6525 family protein [Pseudoruegeria sp. HB172150]|uniref:DUF6525 family protein n=1 Tax=Pseudoruegeria sp. HB172150 TaxID=2721164 RepID=UPI0020A686B7